MHEFKLSIVTIGKIMYVKLHAPPKLDTARQEMQTVNYLEKCFTYLWDKIFVETDRFIAIPKLKAKLGRPYYQFVADRRPPQTADRSFSNSGLSSQIWGFQAG